LFEKSSLKYIGAMHTDISHFNTRILKKNGIALTNVPGYATEAVAELTISALLNISRRTLDAMNFVKKGNWGFETFMGRELKGKTLGIIGLGRIGTRVEEIAEGFGMKVVHYTPSKKSDKNFLELNELLKQSDVVSLHCSLNGETEGILNASKLKLMKKGSVLLNSARSELVDLESVYKICKQKRIFAWFEAVEQEEIRGRFNKLDNVYLTPHFGWMTREAQQELRDITLNNIKSYLEGKNNNLIQ
jgi:phosphoglycerate dehydrogenase-like enzyme